MKIMHVLLSRGFAGSERSTAESCNQQCLEHDVCLVIRRDHRRRGASIRDHLDARVQVIEVAPKLLTQWQLWRAVTRFDADVIHCHLRRSTRLVARIKPQAATVSTLHIEVNGPHFLHMDGLVCNAHWQLQQIPTEYQGQTFKANNSLVPHRRLDLQESSALRESLGMKVDDLLIGAIGRYHESKGWDVLIRAFQQLDKPANVKLVFFGSGSQEAKLKELAGDDAQIQFFPFRDDIKDIYQCLDLCVCPSRFDPLPRVILEAMDAGTPVIASDIGGCKELIEDYGGDLFEMDNVAALAHLLADRITTRPERHRPDLTAHYLANTNAAMTGFYRELVALKFGVPAIA